MTVKQAKVSEFYDGYWPVNPPDHSLTAQHVRSLISARTYENALDAGCGAGTCSITLSDMAAQVTAVDISQASLQAASDLAARLGKTNIDFRPADLLRLPFADNAFDLVWCWGVIHHTTDPGKALGELVRVLRTGGELVLAVYHKSWATPLHEAVRRVCLRMGKRQKRVFLSVISRLVDGYSAASGKRPARDDNPLSASKVEDWYFVPEKHFYDIDELRGMFAQAGLSFELVTGKSGRFKSTSNIIVKGVKRYHEDHATA